MKKLSAISILVCVAMLGGLCGCASDSDKESSQSTTENQPPPKPKKDKRPIEERLTVGMTMDEVKAACGNPKNVSMSSDGTQVWNYNNQQNAFIPYYSLSGGKIHYVTIFFDSAGKVKSWNSTSSGAY